MTVDEIRARIREALPEAGEIDVGTVSVSVPNFACGDRRGRHAELEVMPNGRITLYLWDAIHALGETQDEVHPDRLDAAIAIAKAWPTLGEPKS